MPRLVRSLARALLTGVLVVAAVTAHAVIAQAATGADTQVHGDDAEDRYVGTGGLLLPASVPHAERQEVAACAECRWRLVAPCRTAPEGNAFAGQPACTSVVRGCPGGELLRTWLSRGGGPWRDVGLSCLTDGPVTVTDLASAVRDRVERGLPALAPAAQPGTGVLAQIPVHLRTGQASRVEWEVTVLGHPVRIGAAGRWAWDFGDGSHLVTGDPGGAFPQGGVQHAYRGPGRFPATCTAVWTASFSVDGLGPFPVAEPVRQRAGLRIEVGEGRAQLTVGSMAQ